MGFAAPETGAEFRVRYAAARKAAHEHSNKGVPNVTFEVGQKVVYPNHGVSVVEEISSAKFDDVEQMLFHLRLLSNNSKVMS